MAAITIRNIDEQLRQQLRIRAAQHGCSMEDEARNILRAALSEEPPRGESLVESIRARLAPFGGLDLELPARVPIREPGEFGR